MAKHTRLKKLVVVLTLLVFLSGCGAPLAQYARPAGNMTVLYRDGQSGRAVLRVVDHEAGVVCYISAWFSGTSIDCMALSQTGLDD